MARRSSIVGAWELVRLPLPLSMLEPPPGKERKPRHYPELHPGRRCAGTSADRTETEHRLSLKESHRAPNFKDNSQPGSEKPLAHT